jgi:2-iminobutanoate/2-iminopropanoate deaminase
MNDATAPLKFSSPTTVSKPGGHYSHLARNGTMAFVSGQLPVSPDGTIDVSASFEDQAHLAVSNLLAVLASEDIAKDRLLKVTVYIVGVENWPAFNRVYAHLMGEARPARAIVPVPDLHHGFLVEIEAVAAAS